MRSSLKTILACAAVAGSVTAADAALYDMPVAGNAYITFGGLDWAWAAPLDFGSVDLSYQAQFGWRMPTVSELAAAPTALDFMFAGANVPFGGTDPVSGSFFAYTDASLTGDAACAAAYFSSYRHCDWGNGPGTLNDPLPWNGPPGYAEAIVVRGVNGQVPVPAAFGLLATGLAFFGLKRRRKAA